MKYKIFGPGTGLRMSEYVLGAGNFGTGWGHGASESDSLAIIDKYLEAGGNTIDTADSYQLGESETILGNLIGDRRDSIILASKYTTGAAAQPGLLTTGNNRKNMVRSVEDSLRRLKTDRIDLYWVHLEDGQTAMDEIVRGFDDLVRQGKILYGGLSNFPAWRVAGAAALNDIYGWSPIAGIQIEYSLIERTAERELLPMAEAYGIGTAFWSPLGGGLLTGKYRDGAVQANSRLEKWGAVIRKEDSDRSTAILDAVEKIGKVTGYSAADVSLAWIRQRFSDSLLSAVTIIGPRTVQQLDQNLRSLETELSPEQLKQLDEVSSIPLGYPHQQNTKQSGVIFRNGFGGVASKLTVK